MYSQGESEEIVGKALKGRRDDVMLASKMHYPMGDDPNHRGIEREVLPVCQRYGMGTLVWSPLGRGLLTGRYRKGQQTGTHRSGGMPQHFSDERKLNVVEKLIPLAEKAGLPMTHLAMAFTIAHPVVTSAIIGPRTTEQLDDLLAERSAA